MNSAHNHVRAAHLDEALHKGWVEFWYQPKIDLRRKQLIGVESFARIRHPELGILPATSFMATASDHSVVALSEQALISALMTSQNLSELGVNNLRLAINVGAAALAKLPITSIVQKYWPNTDTRLHLIFDVTENQLSANIDAIEWISAQFQGYGFSLAVGDFGHSLLPVIGDRTACQTRLIRIVEILKKFKGVRFSEKKLGRSIVTDCSVDPKKQALCACLIEVAHIWGSSAVAVGIEKTSDLETLKNLGCAIGQGFLFGPPMPEEEFIGLVWQRSLRQDGAKLDPTITFERAQA
jgi:EAL domain-containing protein (putative c-di-GMP-specific phosphodiesterase class I)